MQNKHKSIKGFTLIEVLVVVALIAILAAVTIIAINPAKNFADTRNTTRQADVTQILNAMTQYTSEQGNQLSDFGTIPVCPTVASLGTASGNIDLSTLLVDEYIVAIPIDPTTGTAADTGYTVCRTAGNRITVSAPDAENSVTVSVSR